MSLYQHFKAAKPCNETKFVKEYSFKKDDINYKIILAKRHANRRSILHCVDDHIEWEQFPLLPRIWSRRLNDIQPICKFEKPKGETVIFVIKGNPCGVTGLDDGLFRGVKKFNKDYINLMAFKNFKTFKV